MSEELKETHTVEEPTRQNDEVAVAVVADNNDKNQNDSRNKPEKKRRKRRNYDAYDEEVAKEEAEEKTQKKLKTDSSKGDQGEIIDEDASDLDDAKLDMLMGKDVDEEEDDLAEIDTSNIITGGRRTRGKVIDFKKTAEKLEGKKEEEAAMPTNEDDDEEEDPDVEFKE
ncbi:Chz1p NDAI_0B06040 [Naumovozyma dairenensis CBS 421]|uniref:Histone H2A.Z-specific chaperone CHZ1 n=1 Tax=Naumovozyma dairenensis (strain ATCC 10597 / BCRC 20456 / CBS 421 / NBRC 0211 / NRRL Y-12639) TaxID=1071378 RepID=G0W775_NAUDC|nr:hypothetical protein NDAI_0B06040 [Naumovozyma dairenensis CBS 421]CCD23636.1 hypothetical protein NDAI_0B06040 [Naumovozyma dairenensis CBS 421]